jgi:hypothetical protein
MPPKLSKKTGKRNETSLATAIITATIGVTTHSSAMYLPTTPTSGRSPGTWEHVNGSFCQL